MDRNNLENDLNNDIKEIQEKIRRVRLLDDEKAEEFSERLSEINSIFLSNESDDMSFDISYSLINLITRLNIDLDYFMQLEGKQLEESNQLNDLRKDIESAVEKYKDDPDSLIDSLEQINNRWKSINLSPYKRLKLEQAMASALVLVSKYKIAFGKDMDFSCVEKITTKEAFIDAIKDSLSMKAKKDSNDYDILELMDSINEENFMDSRYWDFLLDKEHSGKLNIFTPDKTKLQSNQSNQTNQITALAIPEKQKMSIVERIKSLFKKNKEPEKPEIIKLAEHLKPYLDKPKQGEFIPDDRTIIYDFFKNERPPYFRREYRDSTEEFCFYEEIFTDVDGRKRKIQFRTMAGRTTGLVERPSSVGVDSSRLIIPFEETYNHDFETEYIFLIKYSKFISNITGEENKFLNEFGRLMNSISKEYGASASAEYLAGQRGGDEFFRLIKEQPEYVKMKASFDRAYEEYKKTEFEFRQNESDRKKDFEKTHQFDERIKGNVIDLQAKRADRKMEVNDIEPDKESGQEQFDDD